jgi:hypothetical protein
MAAKPTLVQLILNATAAGKAMLTAANAAAQKVLLSLGNVDNTSDVNKPVSTAQATADGLRVLKAGDTMTGQLINSTNGAASTPPILVSGTWFTGGTGTTTKPTVLVEPSGTTTTSWNTSGTGFGLNAPSGFSGNLIDAKVNNSTTFSVGNSSSVGRGLYTNLRADFWNYRFSVQQFGAVIERGGYFGVTSSDDSSTSADCTLSRASAGVWQVGTTGVNASGSLNLTNITASGLVCAGVYTVATLPSASANAYKEANVSDALTPTMGSTVSGGGSVKTKVRSNGTNWTVCGI